MYNVQDWDNPRRLPPGAAAVLAFAGAFGIIVPSMSQAWYTGPIASAGTGDIGIMTGFVVSGLLYLILRMLERRWTRIDVV
jgi:purine-cytosine permease-like protein